MTAADLYYRIVSRVRHRFSASNTLGHGIHSPYLYYLVRFLIYDDTPYYCFADIERLRRRLLADERKIYVEDLGTGVSGERRISDIASSSLMPQKQAQMIFRLLNYLHPDTCLELGTNLGITASYMSKAVGKNGKVFTFEGAKELIAVAKKNWQKLACENLTAVEGNIDLTLPQFLEKVETVDFAVVDANHTYEATMRYFSLLLEKCNAKSILMFDDIHYSKQMNRAWQDIKNTESVTTTMDFCDFGLVFFDPQYMRKHFKLRF